uniref:Laminin, alpha 1 n=1 Tax=Tetraodon nigroviridis TaxID=99883 RepID=H3D7M5_TETNG
GLFPAILNLASNAVIDSNATCGDPGPEVYCKLVEHVPGRPVKNPHCARCDANSVLFRERHPITNAIDGTNRWWQSPSIKNGRQFHWVTVTLDLKQVFQVAYVIIKAANSPRPGGNWILERSLDGLTFDPWQYYAISDSECLSRYNVTPRLGPPTYKKDTEVICTSYYSRLNPLEHGEIHTSLINGRPGADDLTSELLNFTSARYIRLRLQRIRTLNADLMTLSTRDPRDIDPIVTRRYYYSIKDISVGGMCICYGHAQSCPLDLVTKKLQCVCEHNTCGESCNECCPGYHQQPWQPGTVSEGNTCEKCNCHNKATDCFYNQTVAELSLSLDLHGLRRGGGVCVSCQQNTAGVNCESCVDGYYRPAEVSPYSDFPCVACSCDPRGSESPVCSRGDTQPGQCVCKQGFTGRQCDTCAFGYRDFPQCVRCECHSAGSTNADPCTPCTCKVNVMGANCDLCKPGFYNLQASNPLGCTDCFCFGVSDVCESSAWSTAQVLHVDAWLLPHPAPPLTPVVHDNDLHTPGNTSSGHSYQEILLWEAPDSFLGNKLGSYGGFLNYSLVYDVPLDNQDHSLPAHSDVIITGNGRALHSSPHFLFLSPLAESWVAMAIADRQLRDVETGDPVSRDELLLALANVTALTVRVGLNTSADGPIRLRLVSLDSADPSSASTQQAVAVETCECPWGYSGTSCEVCLSGFYRVGGVLFGGNCMQCECNDHATECDSAGVCLLCSSGCAHNTSGPHCEECLPGFYGNATEGTADDCQPCPCPLTNPSNSFSPTCVLEASGQVSCDRCQEGYTGTTCERCASGFYGNPQVVGGTCVRCDCHGNVNVSEAGHCDVVTGECLRCLFNTGGPHCEVCQPGYYGDAVRAKNCQECGCDVVGAVSSVCDVTTGQCLCRENVTGRACERCQSGFFGLRREQGCQGCGCNQSGSLSESCDEEGRCRCMTGVGGDKCDRCGHGYYGADISSCRACTCVHTGGNCDPQTGECTCPANTEGPTCGRCKAGYWGHNPTTGCEVPCSCSVEGSSALECDLTNGQCQCREGFGGKSCDHCATGYHGYPACLPCGCDLAGTAQDMCHNAEYLRVCEHGAVHQCVCFQVGVSGRRCEECVSGRFALSADHPDGCSPCFCSGVSGDCEEQGGLLRVPLTLDPSPAPLSVVSQSNLRGVVSGVYQQGGDMLLDTRQLNTSGLAGPLYWRLPPQFEGPQLLSYGGSLSYTITFYAEDGSGLSNQEPQVMIRGGTLKKMVIYTDMVAPSNGITTKHEIRMTEHKWKYFNSVLETSVSHPDFMSVLGNIEYLIIKASYGSRLQQSRISNITMETAVEAAEGSEVIGDLARSIESCICPTGYTGLSCQQGCAAGFFHQPLSELSSQRQRFLSVRPCVPCRCSNHSERCDVESGECQDCQHHTSGESCQQCAPGYHGNVSGSISDCSLCACPLKDNSFSATCVSEGLLGDFRCTACQSGYQGRYCERCSTGFYGNPSVPGGVCLPCDCSGWGSRQPVCNNLSGKCDCKAGVKGRSCDQCEDRHILQEGECVSCDDSCTGVLLNELEDVDHHLRTVNISSLAVASYLQLAQLEKQSRQLQALVAGDAAASQQLSRLEEQLGSVSFNLSVLEQQVGSLNQMEEMRDASAQDSVYEGSRLLQNISILQDKIQALQKEAELLNETAEEELPSANQTRLLQQMEMMLNSMRELNLTAASSLASQQLLLAKSVHSLQTDFLSSRAVVDDRLRPLSAALDRNSEMLRHLREHLSNAAQQNQQTHKLQGGLHTLAQQYQRNLSEEHLLVAGSVEDGQLLLADTFSIQEDLNNATAQVEVFSSHLDQWRPLLRKQVDGLVVGLKTTDALEKVYQSEKHSQQLQEEGHTLHRSLEATKTAAAQSSIAHRSSVKQRSIVHIAALLATGPNQRAAHRWHLSSLTQLEEDSVYEGSRLLQNISILQDKIQDMQLNVSMVTSRLVSFKDSLRNFSLLFRHPIRELQSLSNVSLSELQPAGLQPAAADPRLQGALQRLHSLEEQLQGSSSAVENTSNTARETNQLTAHTLATANQAQQKLGEVERRTERLMEQIKPLSVLGETLNRNLSEIRELIKQARRQAASIKVAVQADGKCVRSYRPESESRNFNTLSLVLKTSSPDNLLFFQGSNTTRDFLALETHAGRVSLLWDLGSGSTRLEFPGLDIANNRWTRINATRFGARASLWVHPLESDAEPLPAVMASSPGPARILDVDRNSLLYIGGLGAHVQSPAALRSSTFRGCLGEASLNERNVGLWNYNSREGECGGCFSSPQAEETSFHFDGSGFSLVQKSLRATSTSIVLLFKTLSPGGLLLYLASNNTRDFLSIELVEGQVRLTFDLGSGALVLTSSRKYNTGTWYKITLQRTKRKGYLSIMAADQPSEKEVLEAESPGTASDLNRSDFDPIYIGGLPASRPIRRQVVSRSYVGCIKNVEIARSNFDLLRDAFGVRKGCVLEAFRSVSLLTGGYVQIAPQPLGQEAELLFSFSTNNQSGILLAAFSPDHSQRRYFLSIHLASGAVEAVIGEVGGAPQTVTVVKTNGGYFSDGVRHSVIVTINRKTLSIQVDEDNVKSIALLPGRFSHLSPASFFIGGVPFGAESRLPARLQELSLSFRGCIQHLVLGGVLIDLSGALRYEGAELDSCLLKEKVRGAVLPDDQDAEPTVDPAHLPVVPPTQLTPGPLTCVSEAAPSFLPSAAQFGLSKHSHMTFMINPSALRKSLSVRLSVRSRVPDGMILLLSDAKQMDFVVLKLTGGKLTLSADLGRGPASITSPVTVSDSQWHTVSAEVSRRSLSLAADASKPNSVSIKGNQLDVEKRLYLGGLPHGHATRRINVGCLSSAACTPSPERRRAGSVQTTSRHNVTSCFTNDQAGSYFNGKLRRLQVRDGYKVGSDVSVSLDFRTSQSEGVFLGISSAKIDAIGLEMINGQVVFNVNNGAGRVTVASAGQLLCDGRWHHLLARKTKHSLSLKVDGRSYTTLNPYPQSTSAETKDPVYLGGYPVGVKQNCLSIASRFRGCLKNAQLVKSHLNDALELGSAHSYSGITPHSCPV